MKDIFLYSAVRTPVGAHGGGLADVRPDDLAAIPVAETVKRAGADGSRVDDVIMGCANGAGEDCRNVARMASLLAGLPVDVPAQTVNRLCGSGLQAVVSAAHAIHAGEADLVVAGGVESMTRAPYVQLKSAKPWNRAAPEFADTTVGWRFTNPRLRPEWTVSLGMTAENVAERYGITREEQDAYSLESQQRAERAMAEKVFADEIVPVEVRKRDKLIRTVTEDEHPRPGLTPPDLARLNPAFKKDGTVTAGSSSGINDGAAAVVVARAGVLPDAKPMARVVASAVAGVDPAFMGLGPIPATRKALRRAGLGAGDLDLVELNEAFAAQTIACIRELELDPARTNPYGGGIALGHPLGCTGARLLVTMAHALGRRKARYGLVTMCIGVGQGIALVVERA
jgi:3-oxoadipyl-CoA thiolase